MAPITHVPAQVVTVRDPAHPNFTQRKWQPAHWADAAGNWVAAPTRGGGGSRGSSYRGGVLMDTPGQLTSEGYSGFSSSSGYTPRSDADIIAQANAYADSAVAAKQAAIERQRAQAYAQAQQDAAQMGQIGQAQMGMINQIPANIQAIRDTAAQAMASTAGQITGAQQQQQQGELAQNAAFVASQTGGTPQAAPTPAAPTDGAAPAGPIGVNPTATAAAEQAMGGTIPAQAQIQTGESGAIYAAGMPAVVARATQNKIADRMAQAATQDADYRQQLIDAAAERGGVYDTALSNLYDIESKKLGIYQAQQNLKNDQADMRLKQQDMALRVRAELFNEVAMGIKTRAQANKDWNNYQLAQQRNNIAQQNATTSAGRAATAKKIATAKAQQSAANYYTDSQGRLVPKGYVYNAKNQLVKQATPKAGAKKNGVKDANSMAAQFRGPPRRNVTKSGQFGTVPLAPKVGYASGVAQIRDMLTGRGYSYQEADAIAHNAMNAHYGPQYRGK